MGMFVSCLCNYLFGLLMFVCVLLLFVLLLFGCYGFGGVLLVLVMLCIWVLVVVIFVLCVDVFEVVVVCDDMLLWLCVIVFLIWVGDVFWLFVMVCEVCCVMEGGYNMVTLMLMKVTGAFRVWMEFLVGWCSVLSVFCSLWVESFELLCVDLVWCIFLECLGWCFWVFVVVSRFFDEAFSWRFVIYLRCWYCCCFVWIWWI